MTEEADIASGDRADPFDMSGNAGIQECAGPTGNGGKLRPRPPAPDGPSSKTQGIGLGSAPNEMSAAQADQAARTTGGNGKKRWFAKHERKLNVVGGGLATNVRSETHQLMKRSNFPKCRNGNPHSHWALQVRANARCSGSVRKRIQVPGSCFEGGLGPFIFVHGDTGVRDDR